MPLFCTVTMAQPSMLRRYRCCYTSRGKTIKLSFLNRQAADFPVGGENYFNMLRYPLFEADVAAHCPLEVLCASRSLTLKCYLCLGTHPIGYKPKKAMIKGIFQQLVSACFQ